MIHNVVVFSKGYFAWANVFFCGQKFVGNSFVMSPCFVIYKCRRLDSNERCLSSLKIHSFSPSALIFCCLLPFFLLLSYLLCMISLLLFISVVCSSVSSLHLCCLLFIFLLYISVVCFSYSSLHRCCLLFIFFSSSLLSAFHFLLFISVFCS